MDMQLHTLRTVVVGLLFIGYTKNIFIIVVLYDLAIKKNTVMQ